jgi:hypothetical protein
VSRKGSHPLGAAFERLLFGLQLGDFFVEMVARDLDRDCYSLWSWHWRLVELSGSIVWTVVVVGRHRCGHSDYERRAERDDGRSIADTASPLPPKRSGNRNSHHCGREDDHALPCREESVRGPVDEAGK